MPALLTRPEEATPDWLNAVLGDAGRVVRVRPGSANPQAGFSRVHALEVAYAPDTPPEQRLQLLLKLSSPKVDPSWVGFGGITGSQLMAKEVRFYREIAPLMPGVPTIRCFDAALDPQTGAGHLLLQDISATHGQPPRPNPPPEPVCAQAVAVLAALHAHWWDRPDLDRLLGDAQVQTAADAAAAQVSRVTARAAAFLDYMGDALPAHRRAQFRAAAAFLPEVLRRKSSGPQTLIHQDAHWRNFLFPNDSTLPTYLLDWQSWSVGACVADLVYLLARHWGPTGRQHLLMRLLGRYHDDLAARGVTGYPWTQFLDDFRVAVTWTPCAPAVQWSDFGSPTDERERWAASVERSALVFDALACSDLLGYAQGSTATRVEFRPVAGT